MGDSGEYHATSTPPQLTLAVAHPRSASLIRGQSSPTSLFCGSEDSPSAACSVCTKLKWSEREKRSCWLFATVSTGCRHRLARVGWLATIVHQCPRRQGQPEPPSTTPN